MQYIVILFSLLTLLSPSICKASNILYNQTFEEAGWESEFTGSSTWGDNITRTTNDPHGGSYALRWNQDATRTDPITGLDGIGNTVLDWRGGGSISANTPNEICFVFYFRHDNYTNTAGDGQAKKLCYLVDDTYGVQAMYLRNQLGTAQLRMAYSNGGYSDAWATSNWGYTSIELRNENVGYALDGAWRKCQIYFNYTEHYFQIWIDDYLMYPQHETYTANFPTEAAEGKVVYNPSLNLKYKGIQYFYYDQSRDLSGAADGDGYYAGIQIDDLAVYDGIPCDNSMEITGSLQISGSLNIS